MYTLLCTVLNGVVGAGVGIGVLLAAAMVVSVLVSVGRDVADGSMLYGGEGRQRRVGGRESYHELDETPEAFVLDAEDSRFVGPSRRVILELPDRRQISGRIHSRQKAS